MSEHQQQPTEEGLPSTTTTESSTTTTTIISSSESSATTPITSSSTSEKTENDKKRKNQFNNNNNNNKKKNKSNNNNKNKQQQERDEDADFDVSGEDLMIEDESDSTSLIHSSFPFVISFSYNGIPFNGLQIQNGENLVKHPHLLTIEAVLLDVLYGSNGESDFENDSNIIRYTKSKNCKEIRLQRACRTDRGVSAVRNAFSCVMTLPNIQNHKDTFKFNNEELCNLLNERINNHIRIINLNLMNQIKIFNIQRVPSRFVLHHWCQFRRYLYVLPLSLLDLSSKNIITKSNNIFNLETNEQKCKKLNELLSHFEGIHLFHNFTLDAKPGSDSSRRHVKTLKIIEQHLDDSDLPHVVIEISGRSFMLHQIRMMIGTVIALMRGMPPTMNTPLLESDTTSVNQFFENLFKVETQVLLPMAPSEGLFLDNLDFPNFNANIVKPPFEPIKWKGTIDEQAEEFKKTVILPNILKVLKEKNVASNWLIDVHCNKAKYFTKLTNKKKR